LATAFTFVTGSNVSDFGVVLETGCAPFLYFFPLAEQSDESKEERSDGWMDRWVEIEELVPEWGWRRDKGSWFKRQSEA